MDENMDIGFDEFLNGFEEGADGNQTDTPEAEEVETTEDTTTEEVDENEETDSEAQEEPENAETTEEENTQEAEKDGAEGDEWLQKAISEQKFYIKVDGKAQTVDFKDAPVLLQKGSAFDRVKGQLETARKNEQTLQEQINQQKPMLEFLETAAQESGLKVDELVMALRVNLLTGKGLTEKEAREKIRADDAERKLKAVTEKQTQEKSAEDERQERMKADIAEFRAVFPDVVLSKELVEKLRPDVQAGMSMTSAYLKQENVRLAAEAAEAKRLADAAAQNKKNRAKAPGSQRDSGGQRNRSAEDDFFAAFEK